METRIEIADKANSNCLKEDPHLKRKHVSFIAEQDGLHLSSAHRARNGGYYFRALDQAHEPLDIGQTEPVSITLTSMIVAWVRQSRMPSSRANRFFAASIARSRLRAERMMIVRWQGLTTILNLANSLRKQTR